MKLIAQRLTGECRVKYLLPYLHTYSEMSTPKYLILFLASKFQQL